MDALKAGLMAWTIELIILAIVLLLLRYEENKVYRRRDKNGS
jgi:hypothetical protein